VEPVKPADQTIARSVPDRSKNSKTRDAAPLGKSSSPGNSCPQGICGDGLIINPTVNNGPPQKGFLQFDGLRILPSDLCVGRDVAPKSSAERTQAETLEQQVERLAPDAGKWYCFDLVFTSKGDVSVENAQCRAGIYIDSRPKNPPDTGLPDFLTAQTLYATPYREKPGVHNETPPGARIHCSTVPIAEKTFHEVLSGDSAIALYGVTKYRSSVIPANMIGVTEIGKYFINTFSSSVPIGGNRISVVPLP
jgi:hypothetical protein